MQSSSPHEPFKQAMPCRAPVVSRRSLSLQPLRCLAKPASFGFVGCLGDLQAHAAIRKSCSYSSLHSKTQRPEREHGEDRR